ncbi:Trm112 family protein [Arsenicicoccus dermatophilus]|uniref:Trm112 family protein n=1 Tax=Arsenicicoccus dermatophilus TaxID=1076331 RepID=UPI003917532A
MSDTTIQPWLREILRSPGGEHQLVDGTAPDGSPELRCPGLGVAFPVVDGIPVLLMDEARQL